MIPKKIIISSLIVGASAVTVTAVTVPFVDTATVTQTSSDSVNNNNQQNPGSNQGGQNGSTSESDGNKSEPNQDQDSVAENTVTIPTSDVFVNPTTINYSTANDNASLNTYLNDFFTKNKLSSYLKKSYSNVTLSYVDGSANYSNNSFEAQASLDKGYTWSDGSQANKTFSVTIQNIDKTIWTASIPDTDTFTTNISYSTANDNSSLETYLKKSLVSSDEIINQLENSNEYANVNLTYEANSSSYSDASFKILATPLNGYAWNDGTNNVKVINVTIQNLDKIANDASVPSSDNYTANVSATSTTDLNTQLTNLFNSNQLSNLQNSSSYQNVSITYVADSANLSAKTFEISVIPTSNHTWSDGSSAAKTIVVSIKNLSVNIATVPTVWSVDAALSFNDFSYSSYSKAGQVGFSNLSLFYKNLTYVGLDSSKKTGYVTIAKLGNSRNRVYYCSILVKPKSGYVWDDGSDGTKSVVIYTFASFILLGTSDSSNLDEVQTLANSTTDGTINYWISNFIYVPSANEAKDPTNSTYLANIKSQVLTDVQSSIGNSYYVQFANVYDSSTMQLKNFIWYTYGTNWDNDITLGYYYLQIAPKTTSGYDSSKMKNITGYVFTASQSQYNFIQNETK